MERELETGSSVPCKCECEQYFHFLSLLFSSNLSKHRFDRFHVSMTYVQCVVVFHFSLIILTEKMLIWRQDVKRHIMKPERKGLSSENDRQRKKHDIWEYVCFDSRKWENLRTLGVAGA